MKKFRIVYTVTLLEEDDVYFSEYSEEMIYEVYAKDKDEALEKFYHKHSKKYHDARVSGVYNEDTGQWGSTRIRRHRFSMKYNLAIMHKIIFPK